MKGQWSTLFLAVTLFASLSGNAETLNETRDREEMLNRVDSLSTKVDEARKHLEESKFKEACDKVSEISPLLQEHQSDIEVKMDLHKTRKIRDNLRVNKSMISRHEKDCFSAENNGNLDPVDLEKKLERLKDDLKKDKKMIKKGDLDHNNQLIRTNSSNGSYNYNYRYEYRYSN